MTNFSTIDEPTTSPEANNDKGDTVTTDQTSAFTPSSATFMSFEDFIDGMYLFASKWVGRPVQPFSQNIFKIFWIPDNSSTI